MNKFKVDDRVNIVGKNTHGKIAYVGKTHFSEGEWFGIILDEAKGKNNGSIDDKEYFKCPTNYGLFVRSCQLQKERTQSDSEKSSNANKASFQNYSRYPRATIPNKSQDKIQLWNKMKSSTKSATQTHPQRPVVGDLEQMLKSKSEEISVIKKQNKAASVKVQTAAIQIQKLSGELENKRKTESDLRNELRNTQNDAVALRKKVNLVEKSLDLSERKRCKMDMAFERLREVTEIAIIEKEIAEERLEYSEQLLNDGTDKCKTLEVEIDIMKEEMQLQIIDGLPAKHYVKTLENENKVLKSALLKLRDIYRNLQKRHSKFVKATEEYSLEIQGRKIAEKTMGEILCKYKEDVAELYDTVDSMLNADEIVFEVTERNLKNESKIDHLSQKLRDTEEQLEVSEELEETLQEIRFISRDEIECLQSKLKRTQTALDQKMDLLKNRDEVIDKYRELTRILQERNRKLSEDFDIVFKEKTETVIAAENMKLKVHQERKKTMKDLIEMETMKYDLESYIEELDCRAPFMPDNFFIEGGENSVIQVRLIAWKMLKKINLLIKLLQSSSYSYYGNLNSEKLKTLVSESKFQIFAYDLSSLLNLYLKSFEHTNTEFLLTFSKNHDILSEKNHEIDSYLTFVTRGEIDRECCMNKIKNTYCSLSQTLNISYATKHEKTMIYFNSYLNMIQISCKCILAYCVTFDFMEKISSYLKTEIKKLMETTKKVKNSVNSILNGIRDCENENVYLLPEVEERVKRNWETIEEAMDYIISNYQTYVDENQEFTISDLKDQNNFNVDKEICKMIKVEIDLDELQKKLSNGEFFIECKPDSVILSPIYTWAQQKKQEKMQLISNLNKKIESYELKIAILSESLQKQQKQKERGDCLMLQDTTQQTEEQDEIMLHAADSSSTSTDCLMLKLQDMECSMHYLNQKYFELKISGLKRYPEILVPLKVIPKPIYHHDTHNICTLQRRLNELAANLRGIILPVVVDITEKHNPKEKKYKRYLAERILLSREIENELENIHINIRKLKSSRRSIWSNINPFSLQNSKFVDH